MTEFAERRADTDSREGWHLKKEVNLSIIISLVLVGASCVAGYFDLRKDIELIKAESAKNVEVWRNEVVSLNLRDSRIETNTKESFSELRAHMERMDAKLDRLIERGAR